MIVSGAEGGYAGCARGAVFAMEGFYLGADFKVIIDELCAPFRGVGWSVAAAALGTI